MQVPLQIRLLGGLMIERDGRTISHFSTRKTAGLLARLACFAGRTHAREELIDLLWPESADGRRSLRVALTHLRRQLEPPGVPSGSILIAENDVLCLAPEVEVDVQQFERRTRRARTDTSAEAQIADLTEATALYRGDLLPGFYEDWVLSERERLSSLHLQALHQLVELLLTRGDLAGAFDYAHRAVNLDPLSEEAQSDLIRLYLVAGQTADARSQYARFEQRLRDELGLLPGEETRRLLAADAVAAPPPVVPPSPPSRWIRDPLPTPSIPLETTRFFGRESDLDQLDVLLRGRGARLLTLTGPGGIGKTRLAIECAQRSMTAFAGRVWLVPLADLPEASALPRVIANALGLAVSDQTDPMREVLAFLAEAPSLLVLDNAEQAVEGVAACVVQLLQKVSDLVCLVTSRQILNVAGEQEFVVSPLPIPSKPGTPDRLFEFASVQLFLDRAQLRRRDFQVTPENADTVAALCERLEGIPLAIELAAAWMRTLSPAQILQRLTQRFDLLVSSHSDRPSRQQTLRGTLDWSYSLLPPELQRLFLRLCVFHGGWSLEAAVHICGISERSEIAPGVSSLLPGPTGDILSALSLLVDRSLIVSEDRGAQMRYRMLETLREYGWEKLEHEERASLQRRHAEYFLEYAQGRPDSQDVSEMKAWLDRLERERDNLRAALEWALDAQDPKLGIRLLQTVELFLSVRGYGVERREWILTAYARRGEIDTEDRHWISHCAVRYFDDQTARAWYREALAQARQGDDLDLILALLHDLESVEDDVQVRQSLLEERVSLARASGSRGRIGNTLADLAGFHSMLGQFDRSWPMLEECLQIGLELGQAWSVSKIRLAMGNIASLRGDFVVAQALLEQSLADYRQLEDKRNLAMTLEALGATKTARGEVEAARTLLAEAHIRARELKIPWLMVNVLNAQGQLALAQEQEEQARALAEESLEIVTHEADVEARGKPLCLLAWVALHQGALSAARSRAEEAVGIYRADQTNSKVVECLCLLGAVLHRSGEEREAHAMLTRGLRLAKANGLKPWAARLLETFAEMTMTQGKTERAVVLFHAAQALRQQMEAPLAGWDRQQVARSLNLAVSQLEPAAEAVATERGKSLRWEQAIEFALEG